jgi:myosin heavy chain 9/10/11/14
MTRTANDYSEMINQREESLQRALVDLDAAKADRDRLSKRIIQLQGEVDTQKGELEVSKGDRARSIAQREKIQAELDDLRATLRAKHSEDTRKDEVAKSMEAELIDLRAQSKKVQQDLSDARRLALEESNKLKVDLESVQREYTSLQRGYDSLLARERDASSRLAKVESALADAEKARRASESDLQVLRSRQLDIDGELAEAQRAKEVGSLCFHLYLGLISHLLGFGKAASSISIKALRF